MDLRQNITQIICIIMIIVNIFLPDTIFSLKMLIVWSVIYLIEVIKGNAALNFTVKINGKDVPKKEDKDEQ